MNAIIAILATCAVMAFGLAAAFVTLLIGMRTEGRRMSPSSASRVRAGYAARRILGVYVRQSEETPSTYNDTKR